MEAKSDRSVRRLANEMSGLEVTISMSSVKIHNLECKPTTSSHWMSVFWRANMTSCSIASINKIGERGHPCLVQLRLEMHQVVTSIMDFCFLPIERARTNDRKWCFESASYQGKIYVSLWITNESSIEGTFLLQTMAHLY